MQILVEDLKAMAERLQFTHVIVLAHDCDGHTDHVATYGRTLKQCSEAADFGNRLKDALGWPESLHAQPPRVIALQDEIQAANAFLDSLGVADGATLVERIQTVLHHYANQIGRFSALTPVRG